MTNEASDGENQTSLIRPYVITGGRTRARGADLPMETVVRTTTAGITASLDFERETITQHCAEPQSIAELASRLDLPLGVTRLLVSDLVADGMLLADEAADSSDASLIEQLIEGIRSL